MTHLVFPVVHLNGTSRHELEHQHAAAIQALDVALEKLVDAAPHERDYYPMGLHAYRQARQQWEWRHKQLMTVRKELAEVYDALQSWQGMGS